MGFCLSLTILSLRAIHVDPDDFLEKIEGRDITMKYMEILRDTQKYCNKQKDRVMHNFY
jgi:hypothetical protein